MPYHSPSPMAITKQKNSVGLNNLFNLCRIYLYIMIWLLGVHYSNCAQYSKVQFLSVDSPITAIASCRTLNNAIIVTDKGNIILWFSFVKQIQYELGYGASSHFIQCSRYSSTDDHTYVAISSNNKPKYAEGVNDNENQRIQVWQQIVIQNQQPYLQKTQFKQWHGRDLFSIVALTVSTRYIGVAYRQQPVIDIYDIYNLDYQPITINMTNSSIATSVQIICAKMDKFGNLAVVVIQSNGNDSNMSIQFRYYPWKTFYLKPSYTSKKLPQNFLTIDSDGKKNDVKIDYRLPQEQDSDQFSMIFLISSQSGSGFINATNNQNINQMITDFQMLPVAPGFILSLCDNSLSGINPTSGAIQHMSFNQQTQNYQFNQILSLSNPIQQFTCIAETGQLTDSLYYMVSHYETQYYVDCYTIPNWKVWLIVGGIVAVFCCCSILRFCSRMRGRDIKQLCGACYWAFCLCPANHQVDAIQQSLQS